MTKFFRGFQYAGSGLLYTFRTQINFRVEVFSAVAVIVLGSYLKLNTEEWLWIVAAITLVLVTELANTAIESLVDLVCPEFNPKAGLVKDIFAGVVLVASLFALIIAILVLLPKILYAS